MEDEAKILPQAQWYKKVFYDCGCILDTNRERGTIEITNICLEHDPTVEHDEDDAMFA